MRFKLLLRVDKTAFGDKIPCSYAYELSSAVYRFLSKSGSDYAGWLHNNGFEVKGKPFKLFTFSRLQIPQYRIEGENLRILSDTLEWQISFLPERSTQEFVQGVFSEQTFEIGRRGAVVRFHVQQVNVEPTPVFTETMEFRTLSPICISLMVDRKKVLYITPEHEEAERLIKLNLLDKYEALYREAYPETDFDFRFEVLSKPKSSLVTIKAGTPAETRVRGFMCDFRLTAPVELMKVMYESGIGGKGSMGFGMVK